MARQRLYATDRMLTSRPDPQDVPSVTPASVVWGWFFFLMLMFWPRVVILTFWLFGSQLGDAFRSWVVPAIGFLVLPSTTVAYAFMWGATSHGVHGAEWLVVAVGLLIDLTMWALGRRLL